MKAAYFHCFAGASGDMILGALLDAGLDLETLKESLARLSLSHYRLEARKVVKRGVGGTQAVVEVDDHHHGHHHRHLHHIEEIIGGSGLDEAVREKSLAIFRRLAEAEAKVHRTTVEHIHFHEVGAMDAIIDVVGAVAGLSALGIRRVFCSPLHVGAGTVECAHGVLPVPAPATAELVRGKPVYSTGVEGELLTPTGAAILTTLAEDFGPMPLMTVEGIGYGAGTSDPAIPNLLRMVVGDMEAPARNYLSDRVAVLEANIDDMSPQIYDHLVSKALEAGALDVYFASVQMKKNRPGTLLTLVCPPDRVEAFADLLFRETTSIGLRWRVEDRLKLHRKIREVSTSYGTIRVKASGEGERLLSVTPEYEDCRRAACEKGVPLKEVMEEARRAARESLCPR